MVTIEINHPEAKQYTNEELETIALKLVYNYLDLKSLENKEIDHTPYEVSENDLTNEEKEALKNYKQNKEIMKFYNLKA